MLWIIIPVAWLVFGYIAGRIAYFEFDEVAMAVLMMAFGPLGYLIAMISYSNDKPGGRRVAHFLPADYKPAFFKFLSNRSKNKSFNPFNIKGF